MCCYENDILPHKAPVFSRPCMATCQMETHYATLLHSISHSCPCWVGLLSSLDLSALCLCTHPFTVPPYLCLRRYLHTFHPTHTFLSLNPGKCETHAKWFTLTANVLHSLVVKGFCYFIFLRISVFRISSDHIYPYVLCNSIVSYSEHVWVIVYSWKRENVEKVTYSKTSYGFCLRVIWTK